ncbi:MAG: hypothetical protein ABI852_14270, partial [Gemmatimonadaceae bacterium]
NAEVEKVFGVRNDHVSTPIVISPRAGFSYTLGSSQEVGAFTGAARAPRAVIRGGFGVFASGSTSGPIGSALDNTGLASGAQQLYCVGDAAPIPDWTLYATNPGGIPDHCADGSAGTVFSNSAPNVSLISKAYHPPKSLRSNFSWSGSILDARFSTNIDATYSYNINQARSVDINFNPLQRFELNSEDGRPIFVEPTSIVQTTGAIASRDARVSQSFSRVTEYRSDLKSQSAQLQIRLSPIYRGVSKFYWSTSYTYQNLREQVSGFSSTAGNPLDVQWARSAQGPHQISYNLRYTFFKLVAVGWNGSFRSGASYTPGIASDVNGDGYSNNDRAFIYDPKSAGDATFGAALQQLIDNSNPAARRCLLSQVGKIAARNSCRGPWQANGSLNVSVDRVKFRLPNRTSVQFSVTNPMGAADLLFHGNGKLSGWGQNVTPDASLLYVRGFDPATKQYKYEVNQRFGKTNPQYLTNRSPVSMTVTFKVDLGPTRERQMLQQQFGFSMKEGGRGWESNYRSIGSNGIQNPMTTILRQQDSLRLTSVQADSIASMNRRYVYRTDSLWTPVARRFAALDTSYRIGIEYDRYLSARHDQIDFMIDVVNSLRELLTPAQRRKLPQSINNMLDPQYLRAMRNGNGMYIPFGGSIGLNMGG